MRRRFAATVAGALLFALAAPAVALDTDGDGDSDAQELANMTNPLDATDLLKIISFTPAPGFDFATNPIFDITFSTFPGLTYSLECDTTLNFNTSTVLGPVAPTDYIHSATISLDNGGRDYVRVRRD